MNKKGISLIVLIITIVILLILLSVTTVSVGDSIQNSRKSAFASDLASLQDAVNVYYIQNGELPIVSEGNKYVEYVYKTNNLVDKEDSSNIIELNTTYINEFKQELVSNFDITDGENIVSDTVFYKIDLAKINVEKTKRGTGKNGENDIYIVAYPSQNIYYLKGLSIEGKVYFSLVNLTEYNAIKNNEPEATDTTEIIQEVTGISVKREKKAWTNTLDIIIEAYLESSDSIYVRVPVRNEDIKLATTTGQNIINLKSLTGSLSLTEAEISTFNELENKEKYLTVIKKQGNIEVGSVKVNLTNYETVAPIVPLKADGTTLDFTVSSSDGQNTVSFVAKDSISGIKEVRYVYLTQFDSNGIPQAVYKNEEGEDITEFTAEYMLQNGKKAYVSQNGNVDINLPKDVEAIYIAMYDKAGNSVRVTKNVATDIYAGINLKNITNNLVFGYAVKSNVDVTSATTSISGDGVTFTNEQVLTLEKNDNGVYISEASFENNYKEAYVKLVITNGTTTETRIKKVDISKKAYELLNSVVPGITYTENKTYTDSNGDTAILPAGFKVSSKTDEQTIEDGLVILDIRDNEFVWIPCTIDGADNTIKYAKWNGSKNTDYTVTKEQVEDDTLPTGITSETEQITKYGGFYVARYEAGLPDTQTTEELMLTKTFTADDNNRTDIGKAQSKPDKIVWNNISYTNAKILAETVISNEYVKSGLITGIQWDTMLTFLSKEVDVDVDCTSWGNCYDKYGYIINGYYRTGHADGVYLNGEYTKSEEGYLLLTTGKFGSVVAEGSPKNIYDVAGNVWEWSTEIVKTKGGENTAVGNYVIRGGSYHFYGNNSVASYRHGHHYDTYINPYLGFRFVLYVK